MVPHLSQQLVASRLNHAYLNDLVDIPTAELVACPIGLAQRGRPDLLRDCLARLPGGTRVAVEPRHESWWTDELSALLERYGAALCWADRDEPPVAPLWRTTDWGYLRFHHGFEEWRYRPQTLELWADRLAATWSDEEDVLVYFNNDPGGAATIDAVHFADAVCRTGRTATRVPSLDEASGLAWTATSP